MRKHFFEILSIFLFILNSLYANDYIVYKVSGVDGYGEPSKEEYRRAFDVISAYKFPMILDKKNRTLKDALSKEEVDELVFDERGFLEKKIDLIIVKIEDEALQKHAMPLFRGTNGLKDRIDWFEKEVGYKGLSYGISLFSGVFVDPGACVYDYLNDPRIKYVYAWLVDRKSCMDPGSIISNLWLHDLPNSWRAIGTLKSLVYSGEDFHPRVILRDNSYEELAKVGYSHDEVVEVCKNFLRNDIRFIRCNDAKFLKFNKNDNTWSVCGIVEAASEQLN